MLCPSYAAFCKAAATEGVGMSRKRERGAGKLKALVWLVILGSLVYVAVKVVPAYVDNYELEEAIKTEARFAAVNRKPTEEVREAIYRKVQELEIPARREDVHVESTGRGVRIDVRYTVVVDLPGYPLRLNFNPSADDRALY